MGSAASTASAKVPTSSTTSPRTSFSSVIEPRFKSANLLQLQRSKRQTTKEENQEEEVQEQPLFESMPMPVGPKQEQQRPRSAKQIVTTYEIVDWDYVPESVKYH